MATISLCMIVKNEEEVLGRCLDSAVSFADEIIIVDTGSTDSHDKYLTDLRKYILISGNRIHCYAAQNAADTRIQKVTDRIRQLSPSICIHPIISSAFSADRRPIQKFLSYKSG